MKKLLLAVAVAATAATPLAAQRHDRNERRWEWHRPDLRPPVVVGEGNSNVSIQRGQILEVRLPVQAGTGYSWEASSPPGNFEFLGQHMLNPFAAPGLMGGGQTVVFRYRAVGDGRADLRFAYHRIWEGGVPPARTASVNVTVGPWVY